VRSRWVIAGALVAGVAIAAGVVLAATHHPASSPAPADTTPAATSAAPTGADPTPPAQLPAFIDAPTIGAHSTLIPTGLQPDGTLEVPPLAHPEQASWYRFSPPPGQPGPAVILGHINAGGTPGVFARLARIKTGDPVTITRADGTIVRFTVTRVETVAKATFPTTRVYGNTPGPELRLISCGGDLDTSAHSYLSNVIAWAKEVT
jgi:hypothetical protein